MQNISNLFNLQVPGPRKFLIKLILFWRIVYITKRYLLNFVAVNNIYSPI